jgi:hypothetical protein
VLVILPAMEQIEQNQRLVGGERDRYVLLGHVGIMPPRTHSHAALRARRSARYCREGSGGWMTVVLRG